MSRKRGGSPSSSEEGQIDRKLARASASTASGHALEPVKQISPLATLHADVLRIIIKLIDVRPRLLVLSLVCKRLRSTVLTSMDDIYPFFAPLRQLKEALTLFPNLSSLVIDSHLRVEYALPATLHHLSLRNIARVSPVAFTYLSSLTSLELLSSGTTGGAVADVLAGNQSSLTSLVVHPFSPMMATLDSYLLRTAAFPCLTHLDIYEARPHIGPTVKFIDLHRKQLTSLTVLSLRSFTARDDETFVVFPKLVTFAVKFYYFQPLNRFIELHPTITDLRLRNFSPPAPAFIPPAVARAVRSIAIEATHSAAVSFEQYIAACPHLSVLDAPYVTPLLPPAGVVYARLTELYLQSSPAQSLSVLHSFPALVKLGFCSKAFTSDDTSLSLLQLMELQWRQSQPISMEEFGALILDGSPLLSTIRLLNEPVAGLPHLCAFLQTRGLKCVEIVTNDLLPWTRTFKWTDVRVIKRKISYVIFHYLWGRAANATHCCPLRHSIPMLKNILKCSRASHTLACSSRGECIVSSRSLR